MIHNRFQIQRACAAESTKYTISCVHVRDVDGEPRAIATDGRILAIVPVELDDRDVRGAYHAAAFEFARHEFLAGMDDEFRFEPLGPDLNHAQMCYGLALHGQGMASCGSVEIRQTDGDALPDIDAVRKPAGQPKAVVTIDVAYLRRLCEAIGSEKVTIEVRGPDTAIVVRPCGALGGAVGLLMPMVKDVVKEAVKAAGGAS